MFRYRGRRAARRLLTMAVSAGAVLATLVAVPATATAAPSHAPTAPALAYAGSCPTAGVISQGYHSGHDGVDIANNRGTPLYAAGPGTVTHSGAAGGYGQWIRIRHPDGTVTEYGHMYQRFVSVGQTVSGGQRIALMGSEGQSTGPHLHFEVHPDGGFGFGADPIDYLAARGVGLPCTPGGGGSGTSFPTWGSDVNIRAQATTASGSVGSLPGPTTVNVEARSAGELQRLQQRRLVVPAGLRRLHLEHLHRRVRLLAAGSTHLLAVRLPYVPQCAPTDPRGPFHGGLSVVRAKIGGMAKKMTTGEWRAFVTGGTRTGKLATVRADGSPHVAPVWFVLDGDDVVFNTGTETVKGRNLAREARVSLCVDDEQPPYAMVVLRGSAELSEDLPEVRAWATRIAARYVGEERAEEYGARNGVPGELLVRMHIEHVIGLDGIAD
ncbi:hypothetical protein N566_11715 [Streptomycetaceae bacterium MP113-05]|nr:hypothetical protein N566_11715 [Streptomycetaceae bacterium MP113-05]